MNSGRLIFPALTSHSMAGTTCFGFLFFDPLGLAQQAQDRRSARQMAVSDALIMMGGVLVQQGSRVSLYNLPTCEGPIIL